MNKKTILTSLFALVAMGVAAQPAKPWKGVLKAEDVAKWPVFDESKPTVMQFNNGASLIETPNLEYIKLIDGFMEFVRSLKD